MPHPQVLRDMALFVEVAKRKSFSQAAAALGMPISSLSRRITLFESAIGLRLLDRTTRKLVLTSYGEAYLGQATRLVEEAQRTFDDMVSQAKGPSGQLKIAVPPDFWVLRHLSGIISEFSREHENIQVHVDLKPPPVDLVGDNYDLSIAIEEPRETSLIVRKVGDLENALFASRSYLLAQGRPEHPQQLPQHRMILPAQGSSAKWVLTRSGETATVVVNGPVSCNSLSLARQFAVSGQGITSANLINVERDLISGKLERVLPDWWLPPTPVYIVTTSRLLPAKARTFIDFATRRLSAILIAVARGTPVPDSFAADPRKEHVPQPIFAVRS
ncbi:DNA-binding transcriptional LysR family regulator [Methylobacterium brachythecii]|uniref:DNA-binding transcriptional LysR family regulator n=2 Tax=Methylobacterium brachythecii TaxID=1176177 RepID=A0A7W6AE58_9HYPH|nr:LysR family transcriptional regulator [Methylobacterium brachythecii]MBB3901033.1 DNA-binding transcriptional LysR family regulator [Methylobacterium brachythecii]